MIRQVAAAGLGMVMTGSLALVMATLSAPPDELILEEPIKELNIDDIFVKEFEEIKPEATEIPELPPVPETPKDLPRPDVDFPVPDVTTIAIGKRPDTVSAPDVEYTLSVPDGPPIALVRVAPRYPTRAIQQGIEGYVTLEFDIDEQGSVQNARVIESEPGSIFHRSALEAIAKFRFKPKVVDGVAQVAYGKQYILRYNLAKEE